MPEGTSRATAAAPEGAEEREPLFQRLLDNVFLLMALGLLVPILSYLVWGLVELARVPALP